ncbi:cytochrome c oxidase assembly protein [Donghicola eburneus]|uniref:Cytochrome c oxidase assembly protein CtaG n=1 Tax=Donghicola eburneus TaxID=393278 RepID=A0A1M4MX29_9RHOB|nr:cytochrome c oxidase assembly protein [Donghicola eburneus]SCM67112.1 Cytochrome c oxidase assembly protein CtaG [Donghicola eburneus]SFQ71916.1 cytochrome c oxidase assembly protein subunit 11 [Donghicola eburneus]
MEGKKKTVVQLVSVVLVMGALAWAAVPLYDLFCRVTGFGGETQVASSESETILDQTIKIKFDASKESGMPWEFKPMQREMELRIGESGLAFYEAYNPTDHVVAGTASYNVAPFAAGGYFVKIACFCFTEQVLQPGERVEMPVTFYVDPEIVDDPEAKYAKHITLSYTFHEMDLADTDYQAALETEKTTEIN